LSRDLNHHRNRHARPEFPALTACHTPQIPRSDRPAPDFAGALVGRLGWIGEQVTSEFTPKATPPRQSDLHGNCVFRSPISTDTRSVTCTGSIQ